MEDKLVLIATRVHLFPSRTQKLSPCTPTILGWRRPGKIGSCRIPQKQTARKGVLFVFVLFDIYFSSQATSLQVGWRHCAVERVRWTMQRNGATQAQGVEGRRPCANAQRPSAQSRDRFLTFCLLCLYGWLAMGQKLSVNSYILAHSVAHPKGATARGGSGCECNEQTKGE